MTVTFDWTGVFDGRGRTGVGGRRGRDTLAGGIIVIGVGTTTVKRSSQGGKTGDGVESSLQGTRTGRQDNRKTAGE